LLRKYLIFDKTKMMTGDLLNQAKPSGRGSEYGIICASQGANEFLGYISSPHLLRSWIFIRNERISFNRGPWK